MLAKRKMLSPVTSHTESQVQFYLQLEMRSVERGICPIAKVWPKTRPGPRKRSNYRPSTTSPLQSVAQINCSH